MHPRKTEDQKLAKWQSQFPAQPASYLVAVDIIFQKKKFLTDPNHNKDSKMTIFHVHF